MDPQVDIVGWHIHPEAAECHVCDQPASVVVAWVGDFDSFNLCSKCLAKYNVRRDQIEEVFRKTGF